MLFSPVTTMWKLSAMMPLSFSILVILGLNATMPLSSCVLRALGIPSLADLRYLENTIPGPQNGTLWAIWEIAITHHGADAFSCLLHYYNTLLLPHNTCFKETVLRMTSRKNICLGFDLQADTSPSVQRCVRAHMQRCSGALPTLLTCKDARQLKNLTLRASA